MLSIYGGRNASLWPHLINQVNEARQAGVRCALIVPGDFTLEAERSLMRAMQVKGFFDIEVYSLSRLTQQVLSARPVSGVERIDENGKNIAVARAVLESQKELGYYSRSARSSGFVRRCSKWIAEMKLSETSSEQLLQYANDMPESADKEKIADLARIYAAYERIMAGRFADSEDILTRVINALPVSGLMQDTEVFLYGFDRVAEDCARLLCAIAPLSRHTSVYLAMDREDAADGDCFEAVRESAERLRMMLREKHIAREWLWLDPVDREASAEIKYLEKNMLRPSPEPYDGACSNISLYQAPSPFAEAQYLTQEISTLIDSGVDPEKIVILCRGIDIYAPLLSPLLSSCEVPAYYDTRIPLIHHGAARLLLAACRAATGGYRAADVMDVIKSGYAPLTQEEGWRLENYALKYGLTGKKWRQPLREDEPDVPEEARQRVIDAIARLQDGIREARDGAASLAALFGFLTECGVYEKLNTLVSKLEENGMANEAVQVRQVWTALLGVLDQMYRIAGDERIPGKVMTEWLEAGLMDVQLASLPPVSGCITVGDLNSLIPFGADYVFICGLSGDTGEDGSGLLSDEETEKMSETIGHRVGHSVEEDESMDELKMWKALCAPAKKLMLSYAQAGQDGTAMRRDTVINRMQRLFPAMPVLGSVEESPLHPISPMIALDGLGERLRSGTLTGEWLKAWNWLMQSEEHRGISEQILAAAQNKKKRETLSAARAADMFHDKKMSISRLETFASCPYKHFVTYGLKPQEREEWGFTALDKGNFYHAAIEGFTKALGTAPGWPKVTRKECDALMDEVLRPLTKTWQDGYLSDSKRAQAEGRRYIKTCKRIAWVFTRGAQHSNFKTEECELTFGKAGSRIPAVTLQLSDGSRVLLEGKIDRVDKLEREDGVYVRVIDYKSSEHKLDPARINAGMQLQLLLYLKALMDNDPDVKPAGAFYQWIGDPTADKDEGDADLMLVKKLPMKGVVLADKTILNEMDDEPSPVAIEKVLNKDDTVGKNKLACSLEELEQLIDKACKTAVKLTEELRRGTIDASPICTGNNYSTCSYCGFAGICRRDKTDKSTQRNLPKVKLEDLLADQNELNGEE